MKWIVEETSGLYWATNDELRRIAIECIEDWLAGKQEFPVTHLPYIVPRKKISWGSRHIQHAEDRRAVGGRAVQRGR